MTVVNISEAAEFVEIWDEDYAPVRGDAILYRAGAEPEIWHDGAFAGTLLAKRTIGAQDPRGPRIEITWERRPEPEPSIAREHSCETGRPR